jgi:hypothetical protein
MLRYSLDHVFPLCFEAPAGTKVLTRASRRGSKGIQLVFFVKDLEALIRMRYFCTRATLLSMLDLGLIMHRNTSTESLCV